MPCASTAISSVHAAVRNDVVAATLTEMFYELDRMRSLPVGEDELADARNYLSGVFSLGLATQDGLAGQLSSVYLERLPEDYLETYRERIRALTADDVLEAARAYFDSRQRADRDGRRPRADRRAGRALRRHDRARRVGKPRRKAKWQTNRMLRRRVRRRRRSRLSQMTAPARRLDAHRGNSLGRFLLRYSPRDLWF